MGTRLMDTERRETHSGHFLKYWLLTYTLAFVAFIVVVKAI